MPTPPRKRRAPEDRLVNLDEAATHVNCSPDTLRKLLKGTDPPPFRRKPHGRGRPYYAWVSDLDEWAQRRDTELAS